MKTTAKHGEIGQSEKQKKKKSCSIEAMRFFLTISGCSEEFTKHEIERKLKEQEPFLVQYLIAEEKHQSGKKHFHIFLKYSKKKDFGLGHFDYLGKRGNLQGCKRPKETIMYLLKEDTEPITNFDFLEEVLAGTLVQVAKFMEQSGMKYEEFFKHGKAVQNIANKWQALKKWEREYKDEKKMEEIRRTKTGIKEINEKLMKEVLSEQEHKWIKEDKGLQVLIEHINQMSEYKWARPFKSTNVLLWSKGVNKGKTSLFHKIAQYCPQYHFPRDFWFETYQANRFWSILWNEATFVGADLELLKNFFEGSAVQLAVKGGMVEKTDNPVIWMTANRNLKRMCEQKYAGMQESILKEVYRAMKARIVEVNVDRYKDIFFLSKLIVPIKAEN